MTDKQTNENREQAIKELIAKCGVGRSQAIRMLDRVDEVESESE